MRPEKGPVPDEVVLARTEEQNKAQHPIIPQRITLRCIGCGRPTDRLQAVCRQCLAWHFRLEGMARAHAVLHSCGGLAVLPAVIDMVTR